jgi:hypothetical protein
MAKKSRKARVNSRTAGPVQSMKAPAPQAKATSPAISRSSARKTASVAAAVIQPANYEYVKSDLIRIGIIAGALILIIIILTFIPALKT